MTAPGTNVNIHLTRINGHVPWGFRMSGGADFGTSLTIQRVSIILDQLSQHTQYDDFIILHQQYHARQVAEVLNLVRVPD